MTLPPLLAECPSCETGTVPDPRWSFLTELAELRALGNGSPANRARRADLEAVLEDLAYRRVPLDRPCPACHGTRRVPTEAGAALGELVEWTLTALRVRLPRRRAEAPPEEVLH